MLTKHLYIERWIVENLGVTVEVSTYLNSLGEKTKLSQFIPTDENYFRPTQIDELRNKFGGFSSYHNGDLIYLVNCD